MLRIREQHWINELKAAHKKFGYNLCPIAGSSLNYRCTPSQQKMRLRCLAAARAAITPQIIAQRIRRRQKERTLGQKLTWRKAKLIRQTYATGTVTMQALADQYSLGIATIYDVIRFKTWRPNGITCPIKPRIRKQRIFSDHK